MSHSHSPSTTRPIRFLHQHIDRQAPCQPPTYDALVPRQEQEPRSRLHRHPPRTHPGYASPSRQSTHPQATPTHHPHATSPTICRAVLMLNYCLVGQTLLRQTRASPALCEMVVATSEQSWTHTYRTIAYNVKHTTPHRFTISGFFSTRYVDNRLTLTPTITQHTTHLQQFLSPHFYGPPIFLETEPGLHFLGFTIEPNTHSIHYKATDNLTDIMSPRYHPGATTRYTRAMEQLAEVYKNACCDPEWIRCSLQNRAKH